jgi:hypothetical protein
MCVFFYFIYSFFNTFFICVPLSVSLAVPLTVSLRVVSGVAANNKAFRFLFRKVFRLVFQAGNHLVFFEETKETENSRRAPIPDLGHPPNACTELAAPESGGLVVDSCRQNVRQVEPGLKPGKPLPFFLKDRIRPGFSPEKCVAAIHFFTISAEASRRISPVSQGYLCKMPCQFCAKLGKLFGLNRLGVIARKLTNQPVLADLRIFISYCRGEFWIHNPKVVGSIPTVATKSHLKQIQQMVDIDKVGSSWDFSCHVLIHCFFVPNFQIGNNWEQIPKDCFLQSNGSFSPHCLGYMGIDVSSGADI